ncbi:winged helix-turn-helix domain-containing protein [Enterococcus quebecensis]|uniref:OmpR/PhoB-type domain-containing protein n=1 Tax=Enterococcus quebecensis TaxID=903983 RepID=A0A1E5GZF4_9ENTE|nr:winged helix-turn-helix domain-containing protein [Enterococcus quebecensis]OEG18099.1 hypothetical protein BCR23_14235 [Enterococcus quebecensis]OJG71510.1 hypothetical protein RV12_GL001518 [Enterococcus quebecensis]
MYNIGYVSLIKPQNEYFKQLETDESYSLKVVEDLDLNDINIMDVLILEESTEMNFTKICEYLLEVRKISDIYLLILTNENHTVYTSRMVYLKLGADGIFTEEPEEFDLILKNILKRIKNKLVEPIEENNSFELIPEKSCALINRQKEVDLTRQEFVALSLLYKNKNQTVTYEEIYNSIWKNSTNEVEKNRVCNLVSHVRKKLSKQINSPARVKTVRSIGYILEV